MLKRSVNELVISLAISPDGPILVKSGAAGLGTDMAFVRTVRNGRTEVYLPGSSLKGVLRSYCEKICRTLQPLSVCDPFERETTAETCSCSPLLQRLQRRKKDLENQQKSIASAEKYALLCPACRTFGSLEFKGRCFLEDAYCEGDPPQPFVRDGVGINRRTGGAARGVKYDFEVVTSGTFVTRLHMENFETWQMALIMFAIDDLLSGRVRIGMGTSRGLGAVKAVLRSAEYSVFGPKPGNMTLKGMGALVTPDEVEAYGLAVEAQSGIDVANCGLGGWNTAGIRHFLTLNPEAFRVQVMDAVGQTLARYLDANPDRRHLRSGGAGGRR